MHVCDSHAYSYNVLGHGIRTVKCMEASLQFYPRMVKMQTIIQPTEILTIMRHVRASEEQGPLHTSSMHIIMAAAVDLTITDSNLYRNSNLRVSFFVYLVAYRTLHPHLNLFM